MGLFCLFSFIFQLPFYTLVFSEWGCFFLLVRLGRGGYKGLSFPAKDSLGCIRFTLFVHSSQQREERTKKRRRGYRAFGFVTMVAVGVCGTRFARTVLALFPPSSLRLHRPIKAESGDLACILTPSPYGHSPYIPFRNTPQCCGTRQGRIVLQRTFFPCQRKSLLH